MEDCCSLKYPIAFYVKLKDTTLHVRPGVTYVFIECYHVRATCDSLYHPGLVTDVEPNSVLTSSETAISNRKLGEEEKTLLLKKVPQLKLETCEHQAIFLEGEGWFERFSSMLNIQNVLSVSLMAATITSIVLQRK
jgi:hypothetical protein